MSKQPGITQQNNQNGIKKKGSSLILQFIMDKINESKNYLIEHKDEYFINTDTKTDKDLLQEWAYHCAEDVIYNKGSHFRGDILEGEVDASSSVYLSALNHYTTDFIYVEGIAIKEGSETPVDHAWLVEKKTGAIFDPSWGNTGTNYFGVPFTKAFIDSLRNLGLENGVLDKESDRLGDYLCFGFPKNAIYERDIPNSLFTCLCPME